MVIKLWEINGEPCVKISDGAHARLQVGFRLSQNVLTMALAIGTAEINKVRCQQAVEEVGGPFACTIELTLFLLCSRILAILRRSE